jgi:thioredoxin 1
MESFKAIVDGSGLVLVDFHAPWCAPCQAMHPILEELQKETAGSLRILRIDIDSPENQRLVDFYNIRSVPTFFLFRKGQIVWRQRGTIGIEALREVITKNLD